MRKRITVIGLGIGRLVPALAAALLACHETVLAADDSPARTNAFRFLDLSRVAAPVSSDSAMPRQFSPFPKGVQVFHGVPFMASEGIALTGIESARNGDLYPAELVGIQVGGKAKRLHLLHCALFSEKDGTPMVKIVWHYASGAQESRRLGYGVHARTGMKPRLEKNSALFDPNSRIAWAEVDPNERGSESRVFQSALDNPRPDEIVTQIDLVSLFSRSTPVIFAVSAETGDAALPPNRLLTSKKITRSLDQFKDSAYREELLIRVTASPGGGPLTNAVAGLTITDDEKTYFFGETRADGQGICRLLYPPMHAVALGLLVRAPGHIPLVISESAKTNEFRREYEAQLQAGVVVGGVIRNPEGKPIPGVEVLVHRVVKTGPRDYLRTDYETVLTDLAGKWSSGSVPEDFQGFSFQLSHPDYKPALYTMPGFAEPATNRTASGGFRQRLDEVVANQLPGAASKTVVTNPPPAVRRNQTADPNRTAAFSSDLRKSAGARSIPVVTSNELRTATAEMTMQPGILVSGTVLDEQGKPMSNLGVIFQRNSPFYERKRLQTDAQGRFRMMATDPGDGTLNVFPAGHSAAYAIVSIQPGLAPIEIKLGPQRVLRGRVLDRQRRPVPGAKLRLDEWQGTSDLVHFQCLTDEQGRFAWTGAPPDQVTFYVTKSNYFSMRHSLSTDADEVTLFLNRWPGVIGKVYDAETKKPIESFSIIKGRKYSPDDTRIHWERYDTVRGHNGEYTVRIDEYYFQPEARIMVEAPGYIPQISPGWQSADSYTADFALKKGEGIHGVVLTADGAPASNASVVLVDKSETGYMDVPGQFASGSSNGDFTRSDVRGHFEFSPKLEADTILVAHESGYAEIKAEQVAGGKIVLQPWGRVKGVMRVGDKPGPDLWVRLQHRYDRFYEPGQRSSALSLYLKTDPDESGNFVFDKVPPGERRIYIEYRFKERNYGETPLSHGLPITVKPGETAEVMLGGSGRNVRGRVKVVGGEQSDVDWKRDVHKLTLNLASTEALKAPDVSKLRSPEEQRAAWAEFNQRQREFWRSDAGRARDLAERTYVLLFDTNGNFHVDNVPPGKYTLQINASDPEEEYYRQRPIGNAIKEVLVPDEPGAKVNQPFDIAVVELNIQPKIKIGKPAPPFEGKTLEGKPIKLSDFQGQPVLLYFWAAQAVSTVDLQILKELQKTYGPESKLTILGMNLDADAKTAEQYVNDNAMRWPQAHLGQWGQTQVPGLFGVDGYPVGVLIDGEGRLAARQLRGSSMRTAVRNVLAKRATTTAARP